MSVLNATRRFSSRVANYVRFRPGYPIEIITLLQRECGLKPDSLIADIAFGTGLFTKMLLDNGNRVIGVEPNPEMRSAGEEYLAAYPRFTSVVGAAEATTLEQDSVDLVTAAQAAHWFDFPAARREFVRILKPRGWCVLVWNERKLDSSPFLRAYEGILQKYSSDYDQVRHELTTARIDEFFAPASFREKTFSSQQDFNYEGLEGRLLSSSYAPHAGEAKHVAMLAELRELFAAYQVSGKVALEYDTRVFYGQLE